MNAGSWGEPSLSPTLASYECAPTWSKTEWLLRIELADALAAEGWAVVESGSGEHAIGRLAQGEHFDLLVTDIRLGGSVLGWDVAVEWRKRGGRTPVVYVSANDPKDGRRVAGSVFHAKPVLLSAFLESCRELLKSSETNMR